MKSPAFLLAKLLKTDVYRLAFPDEGKTEGPSSRAKKSRIEMTYSLHRSGVTSNPIGGVKVAALSQYRYSYRYGVLYDLRVLLLLNDASALSALVTQFPFTVLTFFSETRICGFFEI
jgi:hypothetical protein